VRKRRRRGRGRDFVGISCFDSAARWEQKKGKITMNEDDDLSGSDVGSDGEEEEDEDDEVRTSLPSFLPSFLHSFPHRNTETDDDVDAVGPPTSMRSQRWKGSSPHRSR